MGIRTGNQFVESLRDGRTVYVAGERVRDVTAYPAFRGVVATLASLYDLQHERRDELTFRSPTSGEPVAAGFLMAETIEQVAWRVAAEQIRADYTYGLMGRMPDFCNALVTDVATGLADLGRREPRFADNMGCYYVECREQDWC
jgi:4-hydroxyphenylacetate 3-monooxygenase/anthranilate 3-monooxygenase (FAD)/4-hydroxyphenylacetate 3-monooxygenase